jgi:hypothetical protein
MSITTTAAIGFGILIKADDADARERIQELCEDVDQYTIEDHLVTSGFQHIMVDAAGSLLFGYEGNDLVIVAKDTYRDFDIRSSEFAGAFRVDESGVSDEAIDELRMFCQNIGLETTASWLAWNKAS